MSNVLLKIENAYFHIYTKHLSKNGVFKTHVLKMLVFKTHILKQFIQTGPLSPSSFFNVKENHVTIFYLM